MFRPTLRLQPPLGENLSQTADNGPTLSHGDGSAAATTPPVTKAAAGSPTVGKSLGGPGEALDRGSADAASAGGKVIRRAAELCSDLAAQVSDLEERLDRYESR